MSSTPVLARIRVDDDEWVEFRKACLDARKSPSEVLAELVRKYLKGRK